ncbi:hypothetical protein GOP47_0002677 [Adiantum capillus-veneris]|uniref:Uncharacterized protein n=1 Tax=Adiantum capillus-veneris TaxID=13818 RepID=A0A9D4VAT4_ADICA|nr:hypothetical protein GOP47_0002677 [Adiantum capillus-veneris]
MGWRAPAYSLLLEVASIWIQLWLSVVCSIWACFYCPGAVGKCGGLQMAYMGRFIPADDFCNIGEFSISPLHNVGAQFH